MREKIMKYITDIDYRRKMTPVITFLLILLIPCTGWNLLLLYWIVNEYISYKQAKVLWIKCINFIIGLLLLLMFIHNVIIRMVLK